MFLHFIGKNLINTHLKFVVIGQENIPNIDRAIIVANHSSYLDVPLLGMAFHKNLPNLTWVVSQANRKSWYLKWVFVVFPVIFVNGATKRVKEELEKNRWVVIFPEGGGRFCPPSQRHKKKVGKGSAVIALSTGVPIIPVRISNADKVLPPYSIKLQPAYTITMRIGQTFSFEKVNQDKIDEALLERTTQEIMDRIISLQT